MTVTLSSFRNCEMGSDVLSLLIWEEKYQIKCMQTILMNVRPSDLLLS